MMYNIKTLERNKTKINVLEPYVNPDSSILVLNVCPGAASHKQGFYYGHTGNKENRFWEVIAESVDAPIPESIEEKKALLKNAKIALWQLVCGCEVNPALMSNGIIDTLGWVVGDIDPNVPPYIYICSDIKSLISQYPIKKIILNGTKAYDIFIDNFPDLVDMSMRLPSTSPINVRLDKSLWIAALRDLQTE